MNTHYSFKGNVLRQHDGLHRLSDIQKRTGLSNNASKAPARWISSTNGCIVIMEAMQKAGAGNEVYEVVSRKGRDSGVYGTIELVKAYADWLEPGLSEEIKQHAVSGSVKPADNSDEIQKLAAKVGTLEVYTLDVKRKLAGIQFLLEQINGHLLDEEDDYARTEDRESA